MRVTGRVHCAAKYGASVVASVLQADEAAAASVLRYLQFTLYAALKGNKPDFRLAMGPDTAPAFYERFLTRLRRDCGETIAVKGASECRVVATHILRHIHVCTDGRFGAMMDVALVNDGPVTLTIDSRAPKGGDQQPPDDEG